MPLTKPKTKGHALSRGPLQMHIGNRTVGACRYFCADQFHEFLSALPAI